MAIGIQAVRLADVLLDVARRWPEIGRQHLGPTDRRHCQRCGAADSGLEQSADEPPPTGGASVRRAGLIDITYGPRANAASSSPSEVIDSSSAIGTGALSQLSAIAEDRGSGGAGCSR